MGMFDSGFGNDSKDTIEIKILDNGVIQVITDEISGANHTNAEELLQTIERLSGSKMESENRHSHGHHHQHNHEHLHH